jgi:hypothetical protein
MQHFLSACCVCKFSASSPSTWKMCLRTAMARAICALYSCVHRASSVKHKNQGCCKYADQVALNDVEAVIASTPWQLRCHLLATTARALHACALHGNESLSRDDKDVLHRAQEWLFAGLRDTDVRVRLAASHHLEAAFRCETNSTEQLRRLLFPHSLAHSPNKD